MLLTSGIRLSELTGIRYDVHDPRRSDIDLSQREITVRGKGGRPRIVKISYDAARALDRYLRVRAAIRRRDGPSCDSARAAGDRWAPVGSTRRSPATAGSARSACGRTGSAT